MKTKTINNDKKKIVIIIVIIINKPFGNESSSLAMASFVSYLSFIK